MDRAGVDSTGVGSAVWAALWQAVLCGQRCVGSAVWAVWCGQCCVGSAVWAVQCGQCCVSRALWALQCGQRCVGWTGCRAVSRAAQTLPMGRNCELRQVETEEVTPPPAPLLSWDRSSPKDAEQGPLRPSECRL